MKKTLFEVVNERSKSRGSAVVESALIFPALVMSMVLLLTIGLQNCEKVRVASEENIKVSEEILQPFNCAENLLRLRNASTED